MPAGEVGSYNDAFFERGSGGVKTGRTSLVIEPRNGRIPALTPAAQAAVEQRAAYMAAHPADRPSDRWLTERCIMFGATAPMLPEPYNNNYRIFQTPDHVVILVEMNHEPRVIPLDGSPHTSPAITQWIGDSRGRFDGDTLVVETRNFKFNEQSRFGVGYLNGISDENLRSSRALHAHGGRHDPVSGDDRGSDGLHEPVDRRDSAASQRRPDLRGRLPRR